MPGEYQNAFRHVFLHTKIHLKRTALQGQEHPVAVLESEPRCVVRVHQEARGFLHLLKVRRQGAEFLGAEGPLDEYQLQSLIYPR